ncbi:MAG: HAMP domain-containing histidine kinase [Rhodobacteraceae bacterium]|nr:HAMP domain-containing histidine kinase [Paracoccaceae bacterium]
MNRLKSLWQQSALRQTVWLLGLFAVISLVAWGGTYVLVYRETISVVDARLEDRMRAAQAALAAGQPLPLLGDGQSAEISQGGWPEGFQNVDTEEEFGPDFRYLVRNTAQGQIVLGENVDRQQEVLQILAAGLQITLAASLAAAVVIGLGITVRAQRRMTAITDGLAAVGAGNLNTRIDLTGGDDLVMLADRINATTARLERAMSQMRVQSANIAHELRTPLARLRARVETDLDQLEGNTRAVSADDLVTLLADIDQIDETFTALLRIARLESGAAAADFGPVDLGDLAQDVYDVFEPVVADAGQRLTLAIEPRPATIHGDEPLLVQLVGNLIQNALRHGAPAQEITLRVDGPALYVEDQGAGIPEHEQARVFEPLYQGEASRTGQGVGLGLAMVRAIADAHGATMTMAHGNSAQGFVVTATFANLTDL